MKNLIFIILALFMSCKQAEPSPKNEKPVTNVRVDTVFISRIDTVYISQPAKQNDNILRLQTQNDSLKVANNKLGKELLHNKLIIQNAKYYLNIANKNPSQQKFLRGWMNRALNQ